MESPDGLRRDGHRLLQAGAVLFILALLVGFGIHSFALPRLGLATHIVGIMQGTFLIVAGLLWTKLKVSGPVSRVGSILAIYGCVAPWIANLCAALWGAGGSMITMATGGVRGSVVQEGVIRVLLVSGSAALVAAVTIMLWGLRTPPGREAAE